MCIEEEVTIEPKHPQNQAQQPPYKELLSMPERMSNDNYEVYFSLCILVLGGLSLTTLRPKLIPPLSQEYQRPL
jgi:hypothetical protein